jgi:hypothetical protein
MFKRIAEIETAPLDKECILFSPSKNKFYVLNRTASFIWSRMEKPASSGDVAAALLASFSGVTESQAVQDVESALSEMTSLAVIEPAHAEAPVSSPSEENR